MLIISVVVLVLLVLFATVRIRFPSAADAELGSMSERWLAEHRASRYP